MLRKKGISKVLLSTVVLASISLSNFAAANEVTGVLDGNLCIANDISGTDFASDVLTFDSATDLSMDHSIVQDGDNIEHIVKYKLPAANNSVDNNDGCNGKLNTDTLNYTITAGSITSSGLISQLLAISNTTSEITVKFTAEIDSGAGTGAVSYSVPFTISALTN